MILKVTILSLFLCHLVFAKTSKGFPIDTKIASGQDGKSSENLDYALLNVVFQNQAQRCGASLIAPQYLLTSASCVWDPAEHRATNITITFPNLKVTNTHLKIIIYPDYNSETHEDDIAIIKMTKPVVPNGKTIALASLANIRASNFYENKLLRACGMGSIANSQILPKKLKCTDLYGVDVGICSTNSHIICTQWPDRDNNLCNGDYGSPLYLNSLDSGSLTQTVVGIAQYAPDLRPNAPCSGGHMVSFAQVAFYSDFIAATIQDLPFTTNGKRNVKKA